jgi:hypothetical protein
VKEETLEKFFKLYRHLAVHNVRSYQTLLIHYQKSRSGSTEPCPCQPGRVASR